MFFVGMGSAVLPRLASTQPRWPCTHRNPAVAVSWVVGLQILVSMPYYWRMQEQIRWWRQLCDVLCKTEQPVSTGKCQLEVGMAAFPHLKKTNNKQSNKLWLALEREHGMLALPIVQIFPRPLPCLSLGNLSDVFLCLNFLSAKAGGMIFSSL